MKMRLIKSIRTWATSLLIGFSLIFIMVNILSSSITLKVASTQMRSDFINNQKNMIKSEVLNVVNRINEEKGNSRNLTHEKLKQRIYEAYAIIQNIYEQNKDLKTKSEIRILITDALRTVRFDNENEYFFIASLSGEDILYPPQPDLEGKNLLHLQDSNGKFVIKEEINLLRNKPEGFIEAYWSKPNDDSKRDFKKISFIKLFKPLNFYVGTGIYEEDVTLALQTKLLNSISKIRFGSEGYIFVNTLDGNALVANGKLYPGNQKLWQLFSKNPAKTKRLFDEEYQMAMKPEGGYIYYSFIKMKNSTIESPKSSFIFGVKEWNWLIGAGVYLDDVEVEIDKLESNLRLRTIKETFLIAILALISILFIYISLKIFNTKLQKNFDLFNNFFENNEQLKTPISREEIDYFELDNLAKNANAMLRNRKIVEQKLIDEKVKFNVIFEKSPIPLTIIHHKNGFIAVNDAALELFGFDSKDDMIGKMPSMMSPEYQAENKLSTDLLIEKFIEVQQNKSLYFDWIYKDLSGKNILCEISLNTTVLDNEVVMLSAIHDVSKEREIQQALKNSEERYKNITNNLLVGVVIQVNGKIVFANKAIETLLDVVPEDYLGRDIFSFIHADDKEMVQSAAAQIYAHPQNYKEHVPLVLEEKLIKKNGSSVIVEASPVLMNYYGEPALMMMIHDITEQKKAQEELQKMAKLQSIGTLAGGIAHDFNNILTGLYGNLSIAKIKLSSEHVSHKYLDNAQESMDRAIRLTKQLLTFSKGGAPIKQEVGLSKLIHEIVEFDLHGSNVKPIFSEDDKLWNVQVDKGQIGQVFSNLTINANQASPTGGHLYIKLRNLEIDEKEIFSLKKGKYVEISFKDEGTGIDKKHLDKIFDPYFTTKSTGNGLGLATTYSIIKKHNGHIELESEIGKGTTFTIFLPAFKGISKDPIIEGKENINIETKKANILVMDDEEIICDMATEMITILGFSVSVVNDGKDAIVKYKESLETDNPFDIILMDITIPGGMGGKDTIKEILKIDPNAKVIVSSGYSTNNDISSWKKYGFKGSIPKPYTLQKLKKILYEILEEDKN